MFKTIGALLVIGASFLVGLRFSYRLTERCRLLKIWLYILEIVKVEIYYQSNLLPDIFQRVSSVINDQMIANSFAELARRLEFGSSVDLGEIWQLFLQRTGSNILNSSDYFILNEIGNYLGSTDREDQRERIGLYQTRLQNNLTMAESDQHKRLNLYRYLGFAAGAILVLCLI